MAMDYRALIAPFMDFRRTKVKTEKTIQKDTAVLTKSLDFFEQGNFDAPNEEYFSALEAHLLESFKKSTTDSRITLTRKFFTWVQKGEGTMTDNTEALIESREESNEEAPSLNFTEEQEQTLTDTGAVSHEPEKLPAITTVDADTSKPIPPHEHQVGAELDGDKKSSSSKSSKQIKITVYPDDKALETDIKDLADLEGMSVSKFILTLIQQEVNNRREDLSVLRRLRAKRG